MADGLQQIRKVVIGLTGGIGCGKSTVRSIFEESGWATIDTDNVVKNLLQNDIEVRRKIIDQFGPDIIDSQSSIDKKAIAGIVFKDKDKLSWLENLIHPRVRKYWKNAVASRPEVRWIIEIPLLFENKLEKHFHFTVCVSASLERRFKRLEAQGLKRVQAQARMQRQLPTQQKIERADFVILNNGSITHLKDQVLYLLHQISSYSDP